VSEKKTQIFAAGLINFSGFYCTQVFVMFIDHANVKTLPIAIHVNKELTTLTEHFIEAPFSSNTLTHSSLPLSHAYISGVKPGNKNQTQL